MSASIVLSLLLATAVPLPKTGSCPSGYVSEAHYCVPATRDVPRAVPKVGGCPSGWRQSGAYCIEGH